MAAKGKLPTLSEYYSERVQPRHSRFRRWSPFTSSTVVCPIHEDNDPSVGFFLGKGGAERFHCFGCGAAGDLVDFHRRTVRTQEGRFLGRDAALRELQKLYGVKVDAFGHEVTEKKPERVLSRSEELERLVDSIGAARGLNLTTGIPPRRELAGEHLKMVLQTFSLSEQER